MAAERVFVNISELYTPFERVPDAALAMADSCVNWVGPEAHLPTAYADRPTTDLGNRGMLPGLVDSHTHAVWAGSRIDEYVMRSKGADYEKILQLGGGIHATTEATQRASEDELVALAQARLEGFLSRGVTTVEIKSGYGLEREHELKMLRAIRRLAESVPQRVTPTLLAHLIPKDWERSDYLQMLTNDLIPEVAEEGLAEAVDVFCDRGAYTIAEAQRILETGQSHGLDVKIHAEQLAHTGATQLICELGGLSADHLEKATEDDWHALAESRTVGTILPGAALLLAQQLPDARAMWDAGVTVAVATDHNPGSSPFYSLPLALQLTAALGGLTVEEALIAGTAHTADALGNANLGRLEKGAHADFLVMEGPNALEPFYRWGESPVRDVYVGGRVAWSRDATSVFR